MKPLKKISATIIAALSLLTAGCSKNSIPETECIFSWGGDKTIMENGIYYTCSNDDGDSILCYYSKENGRTIPVCGSPSCTHTSKRSPDCAALMDSVFGFYPWGDNLYYFAYSMDNNSIDLMTCSLNGLNKRTVSTVEDTFAPFIKSVEYVDDYVLLSYKIMYEIDEEKLKSGIGGSVSLELDKTKVFDQKIYLSSGDITTLVEKEGYNASIWGGVIEDDTLYYAFSEYTDKLEIDS